MNLRYAFRTLRRNPGFSAIVILTLALGIGANTAIFSVIQATLRPLAIPHPDRVVLVWTENTRRGWHQFPTSVPDYEDWKAAGVFSSLGLFIDAGFNVRIGDRTERVTGNRINQGVFEVLATPAGIGRLFRAEDFQPGAPPVVVLTYGLWQSRFRADPAAVGSPIVIDGAPHIITGVLPKTFPRFGTEQLYTPLIPSKSAATRGTRSFGVIGRLRTGLSLESAQRQMTALSVRLSQQYHEDRDNTARLQPVEDAFVQDAQSMLIVLFGAVGFVLLIACANIANLLLARGTYRMRELSIRAALGASRRQLWQLLLTESLLLSVGGGLVAILPAAWGIHFITGYQLEALPNAESIALNPVVLAFNLALSLATGLLFGLLPAFQVRGTAVNQTLKITTRSSAGPAHGRLRSAFVVAEVALTLVLLVGAALMLQTLQRLRSADPGYNPSGALTMRIALSSSQYAAPEKQVAFFEEVVARARPLPGVRSVSAIDSLPTGDEIHASGLRFPDRPEPRQEDIPIVFRSDTMPGYFDAMQIPLRQGRDFSSSDLPQSAPVAIIDEFTAQRYWPNQNPVGRPLRLSSTETVRQIVGVVGSVDHTLVNRLMKRRIGHVYVPFAQEPNPAMSLVVRSPGDVASLTAAMRNVVRGIDIDQPIFEVQTLDAARAATRSLQRLVAWLLAAFAGMALLLAVIGIYGVASYSVGRRTREFGIRVSLGAQPRHVLELALGHTFALNLAGIALGLAGAFALTRVMSSLLFGVRATDPVTFVAGAAILALTTLAAAWVPARRATRISPVQALREE